MGNLLRRRNRGESYRSTVRSSGEEKAATDELVEVEFSDLMNKLQTGDVCLLYREGQTIPHLAMFVVYEEFGEDSPVLLLKGKTKPLSLENFDKKSRDVRIISASARIFYGDYSKVIVHRTKKPAAILGSRVDEVADAVRGLAFSEEELKMIEDPSISSEQRSLVACTFMLAHILTQLELINVEPHKVTPESMCGHLAIEESFSIKLPETREGPLISGSPPFLAKLIEGIKPPPDVQAVKYEEVAKTLDTGDLVLFSGATSSGAIIKLFDNAEFSHIGIIVKRTINAVPLIWEASTNKAGLVDIETGKVTQGVELLPMKQKVFSGWYNRVAVRRLLVSDEERKKMVEHLLKFKKELGERPYEQKQLQLIRSALDFHEDFLTFLKNEHEDLSSLFCSELVAAAYQRMGLLEADPESPNYQTSNEYTPDDFHSKRDDKLQLKYGKLEKEVYIEMRFKNSD